MSDPLADALAPVRARIAERLQTAPTVMLPLPEQAGDIVCRFGLVESRFFKDLAGDDDRERLQFLIKSCQEVHVKTDTGLVRVEVEGIPVRFEARLGDLLGYPVETAQDLVSALFRGNGLALIAFTDALTDWMRDTSKRVEDDALGER